MVKVSGPDYQQDLSMVRWFVFSSSHFAFFTIALTLKHLPPVKDVNFSGQFSFMTPVPIETTILLEITPSTPYTFNLDNNSSFNIFGRPR